MRRHSFYALLGLLNTAWLLCGVHIGAGATPANRAALAKHYDTFLAQRLDACTTCHLPAKGPKQPVMLAEFPHNPFGARLKAVAEEFRKAGKRTDIGRRLQAIAKEDSDGDGMDNETELLTGHAPGDPKDRPTAQEMAGVGKVRAAFTKFLSTYRWQPFESVTRPPIPKLPVLSASHEKGSLRPEHQNTRTPEHPTPNTQHLTPNPIDAFLTVEREKRGLKPRPEAPKRILLRRLSLDLVGLVPTPAEMRAFEQDRSPDAYEKAVDRLLASPRYGERWARHWMDVWRYSDWAGWADGGQIRDSQPHIWRWRDWIIESLNSDKGYDRMVQEMLAADELAPEDSDALRATGFLVRNFKLLSREQWLEDTINHTTRAFLGVTMHCAKCHTHMYDPITQEDYYRVRAVFEPHKVRIDRVPGQAETAKDGLVRTYDADLQAPTYFFIRGDERHPDKDRVMPPGVPESLGGRLEIKPVSLTRLAYQPDRRDFVVRETVTASEQSLLAAWKEVEAARKEPETSERRHRATAQADIAEARHKALLAVLAAEHLEDEGKRETEEWKQVATVAGMAQRRVALLEAEFALWQAELALQQTTEAAKQPIPAGKQTATTDLATLTKKRDEAKTARDTAEKTWKSPPTTAYTPRVKTEFPATSTGRRLAFARWITDRQNPLTARVAINHLWLRHFGQALVPSVADFGRNGRQPSHPQLLDWLASEWMAQGWKMKSLHRLIVTSRAYRMDSRPDPANAKRDPDNVWLWRMNSRRMEAEVVRDNLLYVAGHLDAKMGGPEIDHTQGLTSHRRSLYLRIAAEKEVEFLKIFDGPSVTECYERRPTVMPQQALALANSELALREARQLARELYQGPSASQEGFIQRAYLRILSRLPTPAEAQLCLAFLKEQSARLQPKLTGPKTAALPAAPPVEPPKGASAAPPVQDPMLRACENLTLTLFSHHDFITIR